MAILAAWAAAALAVGHLTLRRRDALTRPSGPAGQQRPPVDYFDPMVAARARWAVQLLGVAPHHRLLEVGCGSGTAISRVCDELTTGSVLAIDRSATAVARATERNAGPIAGGLVRIEQVDLADLTVEPRSFHTVYAINVNLLPTDEDAARIQVIRRALRPTGKLVLCYEQPSAARLAERADLLSRTLGHHGLAAVVGWSGASRLWVSATLARPVRPPAAAISRAVVTGEAGQAPARRPANRGRS